MGIDKHGCGGWKAIICQVITGICLIGAIYYVFSVWRKKNRVRLSINILQTISKCSVMGSLTGVPWVLMIILGIIGAITAVIGLYGLSAGKIVTVTGTGNYFIIHLI